jgi:hypothetical protein
MTTTATMREETWTEQLDLRLRSSDQWFTVGDLFDEFRLQMPPHHAIRFVMVRKKDQEAIPDAEEAKWRYFCHALRQFRVEYQSGSDRRIVKRWWAYHDLVRLSHVEGIACLKCGGPVVKMRRKIKLIECLRCRNWVEPKPAETTPIEPVLTPQPPALSPPPVVVPVQPPEPEFIGPAPFYYGVQVIDRRRAARWLKSVLPFCAVSINSLERQLLQNGDDIDAVFHRYGVHEPKEVRYLASRRRRLEELDPRLKLKDDGKPPSIIVSLRSFATRRRRGRD